MTRTTAAVLCAAVAVFTSLAVFDTCIHRQRAPITQRDTVLTHTTDTVRDTIRIARPAPTAQTTIRYVRVTVRDTLRDTVLVAHGDEPSASVPITQSHYEGENYEAWVSGFAAALDSVHITTTHVTHTTTTARRWNIGIQGGVGMTPKGALPYIGFGVTYNLLK